RIQAVPALQLPLMKLHQGIGANNDQQGHFRRGKPLKGCHDRKPPRTVRPEKCSAMAARSQDTVAIAKNSALRPSAPLEQADPATGATRPTAKHVVDAVLKAFARSLILSFRTSSSVPTLRRG